MVYSLYAGQKFSFTGDFYELDEEKFYQDIKKKATMRGRSIDPHSKNIQFNLTSDRYQKFFVDKPLMES